MPCSGESSKICGGSWRLNVYSSPNIQSSDALPVDSAEDSKIVGGTFADKKEWPWIAKLNIGCGASILSSKWLLTAAHCCEVHPKTVITGAQMGGYSFTGDTNEREYKITNIINHENYGSAGFSYGYDFCLLETAEEMYLDGIFSGVIALPNSAPSFSSSTIECSVA